MKESVFFGNEGLTSTSANYYANVAQEMIQAATERLNSVRFYQVFVASIGGGEKQLMTVGQTSLDFIKDDLEKSAEMNSFCAWVREAIKKKEELISYTTACSIEKFTTYSLIESLCLSLCQCSQVFDYGFIFACALASYIARQPRVEGVTESLRDSSLLLQLQVIFKLGDYYPKFSTR